MSTIRTPIRMVARILVALCLTLTVQVVSGSTGSPQAAGGSRQETPGASTGWLSEIKHGISDSEYAVTWQHETAIAGLDAAWQAPNRAHGLRAYFTPAGIRVVPRVQTEPSWEWALKLVGHGRPDSPSPGESARAVSTVEPATVRVNGNRVDYERVGIVEGYVNDHRGLQQSFTLAALPSTTTHVQIELELSGTLSPVISQDGQAIDFATSNGVKVLHYAALEVGDARGRKLGARMEGFNHESKRGIRIVFDDHDAVYPVAVHVLASSAAWTAESNQDGAYLGVSVATAGDVNGDGYSDVIVGAYLYDNGETDEGRAFVYHGSAAGLQSAAAWTAESDQAHALFGLSVATAGDVNGDGFADVIVGAATYTDGESKEGRALVFHGSAMGLETTPAWTAEGDQAGAEFGNAVATVGDANGDGYSDVIVGTHFYDNIGTDEGRVFVYHGSAAGLQSDPAWTASGGQAHAEFGFSVASAGDVDGDGYADVIVGAPAWDEGQPNEGRAFVYHGSANGLQAVATWTIGNGQAGAQFGNSVATAGDVNGDGYSDVIVGSEKFELGQTDEGGAYVYVGSPTGLKVRPGWTAEGDQPFAGFGHSVATAGDVNGDGYADVIVGAVGYDNGSTDEGRAFVYYGAAAGLRRAVGWTAEIDQAVAFFGSAVATAGDVNGDGYSDMIIGAFGYDHAEIDEGRVSVYHGSALGLQTAAGWTANGGQSSAELGIAVATAGDVNGDGFSDVIVGADRYDSGFPAEGRAFVYLGSASGVSASPAWSAEGKQTAALFGIAVGSAGDVNGDGYSDVIVGASRYDRGSTDEGRAFVYLGSPAGLHTVAAWTAEGDQPFAVFGDSVATAGDVNGDGYSDIIVGAWAYDSDQMNEGRAFVYHGSATGLQTGAAWTADGDQESAVFGWSVATAGDVDGDGYSDVIVGAIRYDNTQRNEGRAFVYHGSPTGLQTREAWTADGQQLEANFGYSAGTAGDVNGDGYSDVIVGTYLYDNVLIDQGRAFVYHGSDTGLQPTAAWTAESGQDNAWFGFAVASAGDVNGDGYADVIVGAPSFDNGQFDEGRAFAYHGSAAGLHPAVAWTAESDQTLSQFGSSVATAGDVNGDGFSDVIIGASKYDNGATDDGRAFVYYGNGGRGLSLRPQQRKATGAGPIAPLGASDSPDRFRLALLARSPFGRGRVKLEWEVKPFGVSLNGLETQIAVESIDSRVDGASLSEATSKLIPGTLYHWRVRMRYDAVTTPFQQYSRWLREPFGGWEEAMLRTRAAAAGRVADGTTGAPLTLAKASGLQLTLSWGASCVATDTDYEVYEGTLGSFTSHVPRDCSTDGLTTTTLAPFTGNSYYLIVPRNAAHEGSYGTDSADVERPSGHEACLTRQFAACE